MVRRTRRRVAKERRSRGEGVQRNEGDEEKEYRLAEGIRVRREGAERGKGKARGWTEVDNAVR